MAIFGAIGPCRLAELDAITLHEVTPHGQTLKRLAVRKDCVRIAAFRDWARRHDLDGWHRSVGGGEILFVRPLQRLRFTAVVPANELDRLVALTAGSEE